ncbi:MAG: PAP/fibrillin family protein [Thermosynechococcaceae cyanobacterium]
MNHRTELKQTLVTTIKELQPAAKPDAPITDLDINKQQVQSIESLATSLESLTPYPYPLADQDATQTLNGAWLLLYSDAREIRSLASLPLGLVVGQVLQIIDVANLSFENKAYVRHPWGIVTGYVRITATFEPKPPESDTVRDRGIHVYFQKRYLNVQAVMGISTPGLEPLQEFSARLPEGSRIPSLDITYLDQDLRLGRGGDGSLFILARHSV